MILFRAYGHSARYLHNGTYHLIEESLSPVIYRASSSNFHCTCELVNPFPSIPVLELQLEREKDAPFVPTINTFETSRFQLRFQRAKKPSMCSHFAAVSPLRNKNKKHTSPPAASQTLILHACKALPTLNIYFRSFS